MDEFPVIRIDQTPETDIWMFTQMFSEGLNGCLYLWQIGFDGENLVIDHGTENKMTRDYRKVEVNNSGRNLQEQAYLNAKRKYVNKFHKGYRAAGSIEPPHVTGMKGHLYKEGCIKRWPVIESRKLNGIRVLIQDMGAGNLNCLSYGNKPFHNLDHINQEILKLIPYLPGYPTFDGELYNHGLDFSQICSIVKTVKNKHPDIEIIKYCIFDIYIEENPPSEVRYEILTNAYLKSLEDGIEYNHINIVPQRLVYSHKKLIEIKDKYISKGYEGVVIKLTSIGTKPGSPEYEKSRYHFGRSTRMFKLKNYIDEEGEVVDVVDTKGKEKGAAKLVIKDIRGNIIPIRFGNMKERKQWLKDPELVLGRSFTFKYDSISSHNVPLQPTGIGFRDFD